jgi:hypothetical protein
MPTYRIAAPCAANWDSMPGGDRVRHCPQCDLDVYNFSEMTEPEVAQLVKARTGRLCARFYQRTDGTMLTSNCPVGAPAQVHGAPLLATAALAALVTIAPVRGANTPQPGAVPSSQEQPAGQALFIVVRDPAGGAMPDATILLVDAQTGNHFESETNSYGELSLSTLPAGSYDLTVTHAGFVTFVQKNITAPAHLSITLQLGGLMGEVVVVQAEPTIVEGSQALSEPSEIEGLSGVEALPVGGGPRSFLTAPAATSGTTHRSALRRFFSKLRHAF